MDLIPVTELKQWVYCERIVYYHRVMPGIGQSTFKMKEALAARSAASGRGPLGERTGGGACLFRRN